MIECAVVHNAEQPGSERRHIVHLAILEEIHAFLRVSVQELRP
jgi:hypothetical protein